MPVWNPRLVYSPHYDLGFLGLERLHPFDVHKYRRAWARLEDAFGDALTVKTIEPTSPVTDDELRVVHADTYLRHLTVSRYLADALEVAALRLVPAALIHRAILTPMRWATRGSLLGAEAALEFGVAANLGGGYHHAKPHGGEGFCLFNDIALAIHHLRSTDRLSPSDVVAVVDLDAHMGNGTAYAFHDDPSVQLFDFYNGDIYPSHDERARKRLDVGLALPMGCEDAEYLDDLREGLPLFLDERRPSFLIFNAGTDPYVGDDLGGLALSERAMLERDQLVFREARSRELPVLFLTSGGYSQKSYELIAATLAWLLSDAEASDSES